MPTISANYKGDWRTAKDPKTGRTYYYNVKSRETTWKMPLEMAPSHEQDSVRRKQQENKQFFREMEENILRKMRGEGPLPKKDTAVSAAGGSDSKASSSSSTYGSYMDMGGMGLGAATGPANGRNPLAWDAKLCSDAANGASADPEASFNANPAPGVVIGGAPLRREASSEFDRPAMYASVEIPRRYRTISTIDDEVVELLKFTSLEEQRQGRAARSGSIVSNMSSNNLMAAQQSGGGSTHNVFGTGAGAGADSPLVGLGLLSSAAPAPGTRDYRSGSLGMAGRDNRSGSIGMIGRDHRSGSLAGAGGLRSRTGSVTSQGMSSDDLAFHMTTLSSRRGSKLQLHEAPMPVPTFNTAPIGELGPPLPQIGLSLSPDSKSDHTISRGVSGGSVALEGSSGSKGDANSSSTSSTADLSALLEKAPPPLRRRRNSTGTIYIQTTMAYQDNSAMIHVVCVVIRAHMLAAARRAPPPYPSTPAIGGSNSSGSGGGNGFARSGSSSNPVPSSSGVIASSSSGGGISFSRSPSPGSDSYSVPFSSNHHLYQQHAYDVFNEDYSSSQGRGADSKRTGAGKESKSSGSKAETKTSTIVPALGGSNGSRADGYVSGNSSGNTSRNTSRPSSAAPQAPTPSTTPQPVVLSESGSLLADIHIPSLQSIKDFFQSIYSKGQLESECIIMTLIYIERLIVKTQGNLSIRSENWKPILFACIVMASKVWDDLSMWNVDFSNVSASLFPVDLKRVNELELALLDAFEYEVKVSASDYAKYYFQLRSLMARLKLAGKSAAGAAAGKSPGGGAGADAKGGGSGSSSNSGGNSMMTPSISTFEEYLMPLDIAGARKLELATEKFENGYLDVRRRSASTTTYSASDAAAALKGSGAGGDAGSGAKAALNVHIPVPLAVRRYRSDVAHDSPTALLPGAASQPHNVNKTVMLEQLMHSQHNDADGVAHSSKHNTPNSKGANAGNFDFTASAAGATGSSKTRTKSSSSSNSPLNKDTTVPAGGSSQSGKQAAAGAGKTTSSLLTSKSERK